MPRAGSTLMQNILGQNPDFYNELSHHGIAHEEACTLVLLNIGMY